MCFLFFKLRYFLNSRNWPFHKHKTNAFVVCLNSLKRPIENRVYCNLYSNTWPMPYFQVCSTSKASLEALSTRVRRRGTQQTFFSHETQFAVASLSTSIVNESPYFVNLESSLFIDEDTGKLRYKTLQVGINIEHFDLSTNLEYVAGVYHYCTFDTFSRSVVAWNIFTHLTFSKNCKRNPPLRPLTENRNCT